MSWREGGQFTCRMRSALGEKPDPTTLGRGVDQLAGREFATSMAKHLHGASCPIALWPAHCDDALAQYLKIWHPVETVVSYLNRWNGADDLFTGYFQRCIM